MAERREVISFTIDPKVCAALREKAKSEKMSMSALVETILREHLKTE